MYEFRDLKEVSYCELVECFNEAFSDYEISIVLDEKAIKSEMKRNGVDRSISCGAFYNNKMVGFIMNCQGVYNDEISAFDFATGVVPNHRGKHVLGGMVKFVEERIKSKGIKKYYLEVLKNNEKAINSYKSKGFDFEREFAVFQFDKSDSEDINQNCDGIKTDSLENFKSEVLKVEVDVPFSFEYNKTNLDNNIEDYEVVYIKDSAEVSSYIIYMKESGRVAKIAYSQKEDIVVLIENLINRYGKVYIKNVDTRYEELINVLYSISFKYIVGQYEMSKEV